MSPAPRTPADHRDPGVARVAELVAAAEVCMLTTTGTGDAAGRLVSRPMALQEAEFDGDLWFFVSEDSAKVAQVREAPQVNASFSGGRDGSWTSVAGRAEVVHDRARAEALYSPVLKAWFPEGLETPGLALLKVRADSAEYWDGPTSTVGWLIGAARAIVTGDPGRDPVANGTVEL